MKKIYLVCRVFNDHCTVKTAFPTEELAENYKNFMEVKGNPVLASWIEEIEFDESDYKLYLD